MVALSQLHTTSIEAAVKAAEAILDIYSNPVKATIKKDGSPVTIADLTSSKIIELELAPTGIPIIGEESVNLPYAERKNWEFCWIVDPLDGTKEYLKRNDEFAVNIALVQFGVPIFGIIASPVERMIAYGGAEFGAFYGTFTQAIAGITPQINAQVSNNPLILTCSRTPHYGEMKTFVENLKIQNPKLAELRKGSALKFIDLLIGKADVYPRFAPTMEWDVAAGQALLEANGGSIVHPTTGKALSYNKEDLYNSWFVAKNRSDK